MGALDFLYLASSRLIYPPTPSPYPAFAGPQGTEEEMFVKDLRVNVDLRAGLWDDVCVRVSLSLCVCERERVRERERKERERGKRERGGERLVRATPQYPRSKPLCACVFVSV